MAAAFERVVVSLGCLLVVVFAAIAITGQLLISRAPDDVVASADAVIVLGGEHDGREAFGIRLAQNLGARTVVLSNPYPQSDSLMGTLCEEKAPGIEVLCVCQWTSESAHWRTEGLPVGGQ